MLRSRRTICITAMVAFSLLRVAPAAADYQKHHITLGIGYQKYLGENMKDEASGVDFSNAGKGSLSYRYSVKPTLDITVDGFEAMSQDELLGVDLSVSNSYFGPGIRLAGSGEGTRPYVQANVYVVTEEVEAEEGNVTVTTSETGIGFGLAAGIDIRASRLLSIPIEAAFNYAEPADVLRGMGGSIGLTFNFGATR